MDNQTDTLNPAAERARGRCGGDWHPKLEY